jgi:hypothetical protein
MKKNKQKLDETREYFLCNLIKEGFIPFYSTSRKLDYLCLFNDEFYTVEIGNQNEYHKKFGTNCTIEVIQLNQKGNHNDYALYAGRIVKK